MGEMAIKLYMIKAYDRVEWAYLEKIMEKLGFDVKWRKLIMQYVPTISYAIKINGCLRGHIIPSRGICQGKLQCAMAAWRGMLYAVGDLSSPIYFFQMTASFPTKHH